MCSPAVIGAVNRIFQGLRVTQVAAYGLAIPVWAETAEFLPNPRYRGGRSPGAASKWVSDELGDTSISATSYFTGRDRALEELVTWLGCPQNDGRARVVTGSPRTGKSALLAHLVALADMDAPQSTDAHEGVKAFLPPVIPPAGCGCCWRRPVKTLVSGSGMRGPALPPRSLIRPGLGPPVSLSGHGKAKQRCSQVVIEEKFLCGPKIPVTSK
jgi:hypothetical protein